MNKSFEITDAPIPLKEIVNFVFGRTELQGLEISRNCDTRVRQSYAQLQQWAEGSEPIYGVTTGFGDDCGRRIPIGQSELLQKNLVSYLLCGTGPSLPATAIKATALIRLISLSRGFSGVSPELIQSLKRLIEKDWLPDIPREGSLGASGDLIPLAYLAYAVQGEGEVNTPEGKRELSTLLSREGLSGHVLKPKEGLALVNGTSAMAGLFLTNWNQAKFSTDIAVIGSAWTCLALQGHTEPFSALVNEKTKNFVGQGLAAKQIRTLLEEESYRSPKRGASEKIQDRYSLRCSPQILGPVLDTLSLLEQWLEVEVNSVSDNPLISPEGETAMGGNFYGGYLSHGMDYLKICIGHLSDLADRQLALVIDTHTNRGLPPNLAPWNVLKEEERVLHHGLKGLHQAVSAITSEIISKTMPSGVFSRSTESHNQDKVSLGMSAAVAVSDLLDVFARVQSMQLICLAQAIDLRGIDLKGEISRNLYNVIRSVVPYVEKDQPLDKRIHALTETLATLSHEKGSWFTDENT